MALKSVEFPPGINKDTTTYGAEVGWVDCDKVRFKKDKPEKIGGWGRQSVVSAYNPTNTFTGVARDIHSWNSLDQNKYLAVGTHLKLELYSEGQIYDLTPLRDEKEFEDVITTSSGSSIVIIEDEDGNHGLKVGDFVEVLYQETAVNGVTLSGQYQVVEVIDLDTFSVDSGTIASGSSASAGGTLEINYLLENGYVSNGDKTGWSGGTWNTPGLEDQGWNRPRAGIGGVYLRQWSLDNWGEDLVACVSQGGIYHWDKTDGELERAKLLNNAPTENLFIMVTQPSRFLVAFGSQLQATGDFDPLLIRWADQESLIEWEQTDTNSAGEYRLPLGNQIISAVQTRSEIIIMTDTAVYSMRFVGGNDIFAFDVLSPNAGAISLHSGVDANGKVYWIANGSFYVYDGVVRNLNTTISKYIFDPDGEGRLNFNQKEKTFASINKEFNEIWWSYQNNSDGLNNDTDSYIVYNYLYDLWYIGKMNRTVWEDASVFSKPFAIDTNGTLFVHESGKDADGSPLEAFIRSSYFDIDDGDEFLFVDKIIPDLKLPPNRTVEITTFFKKHPNGPVVTKGPYIFTSATEKISCRGRGRAMSFEIRVKSTGGDFELGKTRLSILADGGR